MCAHARVCECVCVQLLSNFITFSFCNNFCSMQLTGRIGKVPVVVRDDQLARLLKVCTLCTVSMYI